MSSIVGAKEAENLTNSSIYAAKIYRINIVNKRARKDRLRVIDSIFAAAKNKKFATDVTYLKPYYMHEDLIAELIEGGYRVTRTDYEYHYNIMSDVCTYTIKWGKEDV